MTSYDSEISGRDSAFRDMKETVGGDWGGYWEARVERIVDIWAQGAAHGV